MLFRSNGIMGAIETIFAGLELRPKQAELTRGSRAALDQARWWASTYGSKLVLLHSTWGEQGPAPLGEEARALLEATLREAQLDGLTAELRVVEERPWMALTHAALAEEAQLVVVGKRTEPTPEGRQMGSAAVKLIRKCPAPVWVVEPGHDLVHKLVMAATDLTPVGDRALELAARIAAHHDCRLHVVHAYQVPIELMLEASDLPEEEYAERLEAIKGRAQRAIDDLISASEFDGESVVHLGRNAPHLAIREAVEHLTPDLLVMGSVSHGATPGLLLGHTAERLLDRVDCSILTVKPHDFVSPVAPA